MFNKYVIEPVISPRELLNSDEFKKGLIQWDRLSKEIHKIKTSTVLSKDIAENFKSGGE